jgi:hypothetical protein
MVFDLGVSGYPLNSKKLQKFPDRLRKDEGGCMCIDFKKPRMYKFINTRNVKGAKRMQIAQRELKWAFLYLVCRAAQDEFLFLKEAKVFAFAGKLQRGHTFRAWLVARPYNYVY